MQNETKNILAEMGILSPLSQISSPKPSKSIGLDLTIIRNGNNVVIFCNGGQSEFDLLVNHGAIKGSRNDFDVEIPDPKTTANGSVPYFTCSPKRLLFALQSISFSRLVSYVNSTPTSESFRARIWGFSWFQARHWIAMLPSEENSLYNRDIACDIFEENLTLN